MREKAADDPGTRRFAEVIGRNAEQLLRLVGDLLFLSRMRSGQLALAFRSTNLAQIAAEAVAEAKPDAEVKQINLTLSNSPVTPFAADPARIRQLAGTLVSNAVKFTGEGGTVEVSVGTTDGQAVLTVTDTGLGIPAADLERIFDRFYRTAAATRQWFPGTGLGLAIARAIVDAHDGIIRVDSAEGRGSAFTVYLPLRPVADAAPANGP